MGRFVLLANFSVCLLVAFLLMPSAWATPEPDNGLLEIQRTWAEIKYQMPQSERKHAYKALVKKSESFRQRYPDNTEAITWASIVLINYAGEVRGIKALNMVKRAQRMLKSAEKTDSKQAYSLLYAVLGHLYFKVPGWPIGFGDHAKAERYLNQALRITPDALDANYFMGDYLLRKKRYRQAIIHLRRAIQAPARALQPIADAGRKADALKLLQQVKGAI